ncbi:QA-SNARE protein putative [Trypanosoma equiperdum]|uniref:Syntaxin, putative n=4 Tax=Trypanozoon TaxID=39700 RepID=Q38DB7_TRYB2|nr:syntaxin, putative [Trypanosoma brucei gambiense DAL972]XP_827533.1 syntaxin, putative [Trypanosoma brucei brucei TREU927]RHW70348.1 putative QA-SNARE protein [Trypanosoma brucei equiperdum]SCU64348.1 QA-SNARE protein putative [Trypanosoma equiperdum]EAN77203.1 syntaxin, putative [Trypanosoma brucei brucei TREU927]CBH14727.1 syntaxin, putative [Trypanosoma brucei gambiense DAL972]|eukprot:XP_011776993.1 syntaxin, putative [Trypanosoma brucei gambiense DAL972]
MATRDRTTEFLQYRSAKTRQTDSQGLLQEDRGASTFSTFVAPLWMQKMDEVRELQRKIRKHMESLEKLWRNNLKIEFSSSRDEGREEMDIERLRVSIDNLFKQSEKVVNELEVAYMRELPDEGTDAELSILRNVKMCLVNELSNIGKLYRESERRYVMDLKKQQSVAKRWGNSERQRVIEQELETDAVMNRCLQKGMSQEQVEAMLLNQQLADERVKEFEHIYTSIKSMHEMFSDMKTLVIEQGAVLDRIDYNMSITHERVQSGRAELEKAAEYQEAGLFKTCFLFLVVTIFVLLFILLFQKMLS